MSSHRSLRELVAAHREREQTVRFEPSEHPALVQFAELFRDSGLVAFDANKRLRTDAFSPIYDLETESLRPGEAEPELFVAYWTPVWAGTDPVTGFRTGHDSAYLGTTPTVAMPQDERTAAMLLLVTTSFVHLSARYEEDRLVVQGAIDPGDDGYHYRFVELAPSVVPAAKG